MDSTFSLNRPAAIPKNLKPEATSALSREPHGEAARKRNRRHRSDEDDEFEVDTFEHVERDPKDA